MNLQITTQPKYPTINYPTINYNPTINYITQLSITTQPNYPLQGIWELETWTSPGAGLNVIFNSKSEPYEELLMPNRIIKSL